MPPTKRKSTYAQSDNFVARDSESLSPPPASRPNKRTKPSSSIALASAVPDKQIDAEGNPWWSLSTARRVTVSDFKGKKMVSVREYYEKDGVWLPGKKGITMTVEQYAELVKVLPQIEKALGKEGEKVGRPRYGDRGGTGDGGDGDEDMDEDVGQDGQGIVKDEEGSEGDGGVSNGANGKRAKKSRRANIEATSDEDEDEG